MKEIFELKINFTKNISFVLDAILELGIGVFLIYKYSSDVTLFIIGLGLIVFGIIQFIRKVNTFHLTSTELIIKRPLLPFKFTSEIYTLNEIVLVKFNKSKWSRIGPRLIVESKEKMRGYVIETSKENIDRFELELQNLGVSTERKGI